MSFSVNKLKEHENLHKDHTQTITWDYVYMDRFENDRPLKIYYNCSVCHSTIGYDFEIPNCTIVNIAQLENDINLVNSHNIEKTFRVHPIGNIITK